jgi:hypothetical protein
MDELSHLREENARLWEELEYMKKVLNNFHLDCQSASVVNALRRAHSLVEAERKGEDCRDEEIRKLRRILAKLENENQILKNSLI